MIGKFVKRVDARVEDGPILIDEPRKTADRTRNRVMIAMACFTAIYGVIGGRLIYFGMQDVDSGYTGSIAQTVAARPDLTDRNGEILATDIKTASLYAEPKRIVDADETLEMLTSVIPDLDQEQTYRKLKSGLGFIWLKRQMTPKQQSMVMKLGLPGHRVPVGKAALLSGRLHRLSYCRTGGCRQQGHSGHGALC